MPMKPHFTLLLASVFAAALAASAQAPAQPVPAKPPEKKEESKDGKAKPKKVWTEDDLGGLRKPSDDYVEQRQAAQPAATSAEGKTDAPKEGDDQAAPADKSKTAKGVEDPNSVRALERRLKKWEAELVRNEQQADEARRIMSETKDPDRFEIAKKNVEILEQNHIEIQNMIQETRAQLEQAKKQGQGGTGTAPAQPESPNAPPSPPPPLS